MTTQMELPLHMDWSVTGWCAYGKHDRCGGGPPGIPLTQGGTYICPCTCHEVKP